MYQKKGEKIMVMTIPSTVKRNKKKTDDWDRLATIAEKCMKSKGFTAEDVRQDLKKLRKSI
ncbi:hypothetical protein [Bacillus infantis]|uniref:hypothetical protein n=1 Tax=Bacillus infantis TaxID=324767 RepID=UPI00209E0CA8|nr:hypothetical protein [Bacillus infantis]MCP1159448.1 hypothetical protein [Bacillus infantis]